jgi:DNA-binding NtrC family response regulator
MSSIVLLGLDDTIAAQLADVLAEQRQIVHAHPFLSAGQSIGLLQRLHADIVFCADQPEQYRALLEAVRATLPGLPVTVVSPHTEIPEWLDALDAGAWDYCCPPFEAQQVRWILERVPKYAHAPDPDPAQVDWPQSA